MTVLLTIGKTGGVYSPNTVPELDLFQLSEVWYHRSIASKANKAMAMIVASISLLLVTVAIVQDYSLIVRVLGLEQG